MNFEYLFKRISLVVAGFLLSAAVYSQSVYSSSLTQTWPTIFNSKVDHIYHTISFEENAIILSTQTKSGKQIETLYIQKIAENNDATIYSCVTNSKERITIVKPLRNFSYIDIYRPSPKTGEEIQFRLHLDR